MRAGLLEMTASKDPDERTRGDGGGARFQKQKGGWLHKMCALILCVFEMVIGMQTYFEIWGFIHGFFFFFFRVEM